MKHFNYLALLWNRLSPQEQELILQEVAGLLDQSLPGGAWGPHMIFLASFPKDVWPRLPKLPKLRIESIMTRDILAGRIDIYSTINRGGELGTWILGRGQYFENRDQIIDNICAMLTRDWYTQNYVGHYLLPLLPVLADTPERETKMKTALKIAIWNDAKRVKQNLDQIPDSWGCQDLKPRTRLYIQPA